MTNIPVNTFPFIRSNKVWSQRVIAAYSDKIFDICFTLVGHTKKEILSRKKTADLVLLRKTVCNILWGKYGLHPEVIASFLKRDRTSCLYYMKNHDGDYEYYLEYKELYDLISLSLEQIMDKDELHNMQEEQVQNYLDREAANEVIEKLRLENVELKLQLKKVTEFINNI
tara:strand:- start:362 stop:871 length:510 start_codon:yes stop_codon:yes gene_type:complete